MRYVGLYTQQRRNNSKSLLLLLAFPAIILLLVFAFFALIGGESGGGEYYYDAYYDRYIQTSSGSSGLEWALSQTLTVMPWVVLIIGIWFLIAYKFNTSMIRHATGAHEVTRMENPRVYNIVENLCIAGGMNMPKINVIDTLELNAFASGIDEKSYTVTVTTGICERLTDEELEGVIGHELTHIRNKDTRLLIISIIFVGIMATIMNLAFRFLWNTILWGGNSSHRNKKEGAGGAILALLMVAILAALGYFFTLLTRFAISRKREYMADAGGAELCGKPLALASALRKISDMPAAAPEGREDIAQLFIIHPQSLTGGISEWFSSMFSTHPSTESRIHYLEQF